MVIAKSSKYAKKIRTSEIEDWGEVYSSWANKTEQVEVVYLGKAKSSSKRGVICSSFNAG